MYYFLNGRHGFVWVLVELVHYESLVSCSSCLLTKKKKKQNFATSGEALKQNKTKKKQNLFAPQFIKVIC